eukprot:Pgem_evm1s11192
MIQPTEIKLILTVKGILQQTAKLQELEYTSFTTNLSCGYALKICHYLKKLKLVGVILNAFLTLRSLIVQRTKFIDDCERLLNDLLDKLTTGI